MLPLFVLFGVSLPWTEWTELGWRGIAFVTAVLALRRLPLVLGVRRLLGTDLAGAVWLGWFGPVGVAALYYVPYLEALGVADPLVWSAGSLTIAASTVAHGLTSAPGRAWYGRQRRQRDATA